jgi:hypothetical protein
MLVCCANSGCPTTLFGSGFCVSCEQALVISSARPVLARGRSMTVAMLRQRAVLEKTRLALRAVAETEATR